MPVDQEHLQALTQLLLSIADDKLMLGHRNADWTGLGPILEEDIAFSALAQDDIAHASALYELLAGWIGDDADRLAFGREPNQYRCAALVTLADEFDWAIALARQFCCDHFDQLRLARLAQSNITELAELAARMEREEALATGHADQWIVRLLGANDDARQRVLAALKRVFAMTPGLFEEPEGVQTLEAAGIYPGDTAAMYRDWSDRIGRVFDSNEWAVSLSPPDNEPGGRSGKHPSDFGALLDEMCEVYRSEPNAAW